MVSLLDAAERGTRPAAKPDVAGSRIGVPRMTTAAVALWPGSVRRVRPSSSDGRGVGTAGLSRVHRPRTQQGYRNRASRTCYSRERDGGMRCAPRRRHCTHVSSVPWYLVAGRWGRRLRCGLCATQRTRARSARATREQRTRRAQARRAPDSTGTQLNRRGRFAECGPSARADVGYRRTTPRGPSRPALLAPPGGGRPTDDPIGHPAETALAGEAGRDRDRGERQ